ncbi:MAG: tRNA (N(6)-L-threonylcarbamoyladenosine(37)-C(2))-methylthiotransferase MtaB [Clostridia bacterium]|nr:tRNA (N(6)-L-threonylcarbamoyladenosine(37)-C(2))-methylthiotransferase MtaB [Clostridia bacterium]
MRSVGLYTLGCKVSQYETEAIGETFEKHGFTVMPFDSVCDAYVINTCTVTAESDRKSRQMIRRAIKRNPDAVVAVVGCYSQRTPEELLKIDGVDIVLGTDKKLEVVGRVEFMLEDRGEKPFCKIEDLNKAVFEPMAITKAPRTRAYVKIEDGCESRCTYCAIASARGRVRSKLPSDVIREVEGLYASGTREIVLTGIETGSYGRDFDFDYTLADLIVELDRRGSCERIRLGSLAPELIGRDFVNKVKGVKILAPHFHLSIQSGSDRVLKGMKRRYSRAMALENIRYIKENIPKAAFTTDLMVGFPGESEEDFLDTVSFVREVGFIDAHVFAYSKRRGTPAASYDGQIDEEEKRSRSARLIAEKNAVRDSVLDSIVKEGAPLSAVLETYDSGSYTAHSDSFVEISVEAPEGMHGEIVDVIPVSHKDGVIIAKLK